MSGKMLWRFPEETVWKKVKGLEELQQRHSDSGGGASFDIIKLCAFSAQRLAIFWEARRPDHILELWYVELSLTRRHRPEGWGRFQRTLSGSVLSSGIVVVPALTCYMLILSMHESFLVFILYSLSFLLVIDITLMESKYFSH